MPKTISAMNRLESYSRGTKKAASAQDHRAGGVGQTDQHEDGREEGDLPRIVEESSGEAVEARGKAHHAPDRADAARLEVGRAGDSPVAAQGEAGELQDETNRDGDRPDPFRRSLIALPGHSGDLDDSPENEEPAEPCGGLATLGDHVFHQGNPLDEVFSGDSVFRLRSIHDIFPST
jgi:hypothetical protein